MFVASVSISVPFVPFVNFMSGYSVSPVGNLTQKYQALYRRDKATNVIFKGWIVMECKIEEM